MSNPFRLPLPPKKSSKELGIDTRPSHLKRWSSELNPLDLGGATRSLLEQLRLTNRAEMSSADRFEWLESLAAPLQVILTGLRKHYLHKPFPLPAKSQAVAQLANTLNSELMVGYRTILAEKPDTSLFGKRNDRQRRLMACYRLFLHAGEVLCNYRLMYQSPPAGLWRNLHGYFGQLVSQGWAQEPLIPCDGCTPTTIEHQYKKQLLLALLPSQMLPAREWNELMSRLDEWCPQAPLYRAAERPAGKLLYCIRFELDAPVAAGTDLCCGACGSKLSGLLLDTAPLLEMLEWRIAGSVPQQVPTAQPAMPCRMSIESLHLLLRSWRIPSGPREERKRVDLPLQLVSGLRSIHQLLAHKPQGGAAKEEGVDRFEGFHVPDYTLADGAAPAAPSPFTEALYIGQREQEGDLWDTVYIGKELPRVGSLWSDEPVMEEVEPLAARALDASGNGFRIELELPEKHGLQLGELIALQEERRDGWILCLLRWVRRLDGKRASLGLERVADQPHPIEVKVAAAPDKPAATLHGLTCYDHEMNTVLLLPLLPSLSSKHLTLVHEGREAVITLGENLAYSPLFESFLFSSADSQAEVEAMLPEPRRARGGKGEDPFGEIWASL